MNKKIRKVLTVLLIISVLGVILLILSLNTLIDKNRDHIQGEIQKALGRTVTFENIRLNLWSGLGLVVKDLSIADDPRFAATPLIQIKELKMQTRWLPFLRGKIEIDKFIMTKPEIQIIKNEKGKLNFLAADDLKSKSREMRDNEETRTGSPLAFFVSGVQINQGKIHFVDRSSKEPAEIRLVNLAMNLTGVGLGETAVIQLAANLLNDSEQNILLEGSLGPIGSLKKWNKVPLNLKSEIKSLPLAQLIQAVPILKDIIPTYLDVRGPLKLKANIIGTIEKPHIMDFTLAGAFLGSNSDNLTLRADFDFSGNGWKSDPVVKGELSARPVALDRLRKIPFVDNILPASLKSEGPLSLTSKIEGTLRHYKIRTKIKAAESEINFANWLYKPKGIPAEIEIGVVRKNNGLVLEKSKLLINNLKVQFSGRLQENPESKIDLRIQSKSVDLAGWDKYLLPAAPYKLRGKISFNLLIQKSFAPQGSELEIRGNLDLEKITARGKKNKRSFEVTTSNIIFHGKEAEIKVMQLRLGSSQLNFQGKIWNFKSPRVNYKLRSPQINLVDLIDKPEYNKDWVKDFSSAGEFQVRNRKLWIRARLSSGEGVLQNLAYKGLKGEFQWRNTRAIIKNITLQAMGGRFTANGEWVRKPGEKIRFTLHPEIDSVNLTTLLTHLSPEFSKRLEGTLYFKGVLKGFGSNWRTARRTVRGKGTVVVKRGSLKKFNLVQGVLSRVTGLPGIGDMIVSHLSPRYMEIFNREDTHFDTLETLIHLGKQRFVTDDILLTTSDYKIGGKGWIGFNKAVNWKAVLSMSPQMTKELIQKHKNVRYLVDEQFRLDIPFALKGFLPNIQPKPDIRKLSRDLERGLLRWGMEKTLREKKTKKNSKARDLILKSLDQLLSR